jgi:hypothetical protein
MRPLLSSHLHTQHRRRQGLTWVIQASTKIPLGVILAACSLIEQRQPRGLANSYVCQHSPTFRPTAPVDESEAQRTSVTSSRHTSDSLKTTSLAISRRTKVAISRLQRVRGISLSVGHFRILARLSSTAACPIPVKMTGDRLPPFERRHSSQREQARPVERITDDLEVPSLDDRAYRVIVLPNKLEVLLVHDAKADKAAASMDVNVGNYSDEEDMPGMAHAVEHVRRKCRGCQGG